MYRLIFEFKFLPPGRGLWMMGTEYIKSHGSASLNNCAFISTKDIAVEGLAEPFITLMDLSMLGVGVGFDTDGAGQIDIQRPTYVDAPYVIPDSREGWMEAARMVLDAYQGAGGIPRFDYSIIRPEGTPIRGFGGVAAGPEPLRKLLEEHLPDILNPLVGAPITSEALVDVGNAVGKCVVSGNVRRSAEIAFGSPEDESFLRLKDPEVAGEKLMGPDSWRWASNNSLYAQVGMDYSGPAAYTAKNGEPGYIWLDNIRRFGRLIDPPTYADVRAKGCNPCVEQSLEPYELCCLVETFPAHHESYGEWERTLKFAYLYAKTVTLLPTHIQKVNAVMMRNRRIGTSQSGIVQNFAKVGRREHFKWCDQGYRYLRNLDNVYSEWLAVPKSVKITSVKPSGTVSKLCGATAGMHRAPAEFYVQRMRFAASSPLLTGLRKAGFHMEPDVYSPNSVVVEFPVHEANFEQAETDVPAAVQMGDAVQLQRYWADNQVSCTVKFEKAEEGPHIKDLLELYEDQLKGISFLPYDRPPVGEDGVPKVPYAQAPWEPITEARYRQMLLDIEERKTNGPLHLEGDTHEVTDKFCDGDRCTV
jgi:adenosylcobalamin-dependent ribonucleoside-triphosphate reductase